jgi:hypothetical protein
VFVPRSQTDEPQRFGETAGSMVAVSMY